MLSDRKTIFTSATTSQVSAPIHAEDYKEIELAVKAITTGASVNTKVEVFGSIQASAPDFSLSQSDTNLYFPIALTDLGTKNTVNTISILAAATTYTGYELNTNVVKWIGVKLTVTAGTADVTVQYAAKTQGI